MLENQAGPTPENP